MFGDIFTHTWWQTTSVVCPACPSNRLLQPWPDPQPVYKGSVPVLLLFSPPSQRAETERLKMRDGFGSKSFSGKLDFSPTEEFYLHLYVKPYLTEQECVLFFNIWKLSWINKAACVEFSYRLWFYYMQFPKQMKSLSTVIIERVYVPLRSCDFYCGYESRNMFFFCSIFSLTLFGAD